MSDPKQIPPVLRFGFDEDDVWGYAGSHIFYPTINTPRPEQISTACLHEPIEVVLFNSVSVRCKHCDIKLDEKGNA